MNEGDSPNDNPQIIPPSDNSSSVKIVTALFGGFDYLQCQTCGQKIFWGTPDDPYNLQKRLDDHVCPYSLPDDIFWEEFNKRFPKTEGEG